MSVFTYVLDCGTAQNSSDNLSSRPDKTLLGSDVVSWRGKIGNENIKITRNSSGDEIANVNFRNGDIVDPRAVAVSRYGWLTTSYGWLAG